MTRGGRQRTGSAFSALSTYELILPFVLTRYSVGALPTSIGSAICETRSSSSIGIVASKLCQHGAEHVHAMHVMFMFMSCCVALELPQLVGSVNFSVPRDFIAPRDASLPRVRHAAAARCLGGRGRNTNGRLADGSRSI